MDKFGSVIDRIILSITLPNMVNMKLASKFYNNSLRIGTQLLKSLQRVIVVDGATHSQKDRVEDITFTFEHFGDLKSLSQIFNKELGFVLNYSVADKAWYGEGPGKKVYALSNF